MRQSRLIMGMPVLLEIVDAGDEQKSTQADFDAVFDYFTAVDEKFSTYKDQSEISKINRGEILDYAYSSEMKEIFALAEETKNVTRGFFDIRTRAGTIDPSGLVKGWAIQKAAELLAKKGFKNFYVDIGGDIQTSGMNAEGKEWSIGIRNPLNTNDREEVVKVIYPHGKGVATSGSYLRGSHIYNPHGEASKPADFVSLTVIGPNVYEADRFATAAFVMGMEGMHFIVGLSEKGLGDFEAYAIDQKGTAVFTNGFEAYTLA